MVHVETSAIIAAIICVVVVRAVPYPCTALCGAEGPISGTCSLAAIEDATLDTPCVVGDGIHTTRNGTLTCRGMRCFIVKDHASFYLLDVVLSQVLQDNGGWVGSDAGWAVLARDNAVVQLLHVSIGSTLYDGDGSSAGASNGASMLHCTAESVCHVGESVYGGVTGVSLVSAASEAFVTLDHVDMDGGSAVHGCTCGLGMYLDSGTCVPCAYDYLNGACASGVVVECGCSEVTDVSNCICLRGEYRNEMGECTACDVVDAVCHHENHLGVYSTCDGTGHTDGQCVSSCVTGEYWNDSLNACTACSCLASHANATMAVVWECDGWSAVDTSQCVPMCGNDDIVEASAPGEWAVVTINCYSSTMAIHAWGGGGGSSVSFSGGSGGFARGLLQDPWSEWDRRRGYLQVQVHVGGKGTGALFPVDTGGGSCPSLTECGHGGGWSGVSLLWANGTRLEDDTGGVLVLAAGGGGAGSHSAGGSGGGSCGVSTWLNWSAAGAIGGCQIVPGGCRVEGTECTSARNAFGDGTGGPGTYSMNYQTVGARWGGGGGGGHNGGGGGGLSGTGGAGGSSYVSHPRLVRGVTNSGTITAPATSLYHEEGVGAPAIAEDAAGDGKVFIQLGCDSDQSFYWDVDQSACVSCGLDCVVQEATHGLASLDRTETIGPAALNATHSCTGALDTCPGMTIDNPIDDTAAELFLYGSGMYYYEYGDGIVEPVYFLEHDASSYLAVGSIQDDVGRTSPRHGTNEWRNAWDTDSSFGSALNMTYASYKNTHFANLQSNDGTLLILQGHTKCYGRDIWGCASEVLYVPFGIPYGTIPMQLTTGTWSMSHANPIGCTNLVLAVLIKGNLGDVKDRYREWNREQLSCGPLPYLCVGPVDLAGNNNAFLNALGCTLPTASWSGHMSWAAETPIVDGYGGGNFVSPSWSPTAVRQRLMAT